MASNWVHCVVEPHHNGGGITERYQGTLVYFPFLDKSSVTSVEIQEYLQSFGELWKRYFFSGKYMTNFLQLEKSLLRDHKCNVIEQIWLKNWTPLVEKKIHLNSIIYTLGVSII
jgi:hypothetical protein